jgi:hypothetical protein
MKQIYAYSPDTGEFINIETPSDWMSSTDIAPPAYDSQTAGCFFRNGAWEIVTATPDTTQLAIDARRQRNAMMAACDWTQLPDTPFTSAQKTAWATYRQALRDISKQALFPVTIDWPVVP